MRWAWDKTAVCAALCCSAKDTATGGLTVVVVNNSLVGQWVLCDSRSFAPGLKAVKYYGQSEGGDYQGGGCRDHDALTYPSRFHPESLRLILDESHLYEQRDDLKSPSGKIFHTYRPGFIWCVTGTPASTSLMNLEKQARILGHWNEGLCLEWHATKCYNSDVFEFAKQLQDQTQPGHRRHTPQAHDHAQEGAAHWRRSGPFTT